MAKDETEPRACLYVVEKRTWDGWHPMKRVRPSTDRLELEKALKEYTKGRCPYGAYRIAVYSRVRTLEEVKT